MLRLKVTPVVGLPQFTGWSQVAESTVSVSVRLVLVYAISGKHAGNVGRDISEKVADFYFYDVEQLHDFLSQLIRFTHTNECKMYFSCAVLGKSKSIFATYGGSIFLKRGEKSGKILTSDSLIKIVEGNYVENDIFVLTTLQADQFLSEVQLKFQQGYDPDVIITSIVPGIHSQEDSSLSALVFVSKDNEKEDVKEKPSFIEVEDEVIDDTSLNSSQEVKINHGEESLAKVKFEIDSAQIPGFFDKFWKKIKLVIKYLFINCKKFFWFIFLLVKKILKKAWNFIGHIDTNKLKLLIKDFKENGFRSIIQKKKSHLLEIKPRKKSWKLLTALFTVLLIIGLIGFIVFSKNKEKERLQSLLNPIQNEVLLAKEQAIKDPIVARETLSQALGKLDILEKENESSSAINLVKEKKQEWNEYLKSISGREELQELDVFYDLRLAKADFISTGIDISNKALVVFDKDLKQILLLDFDTKQVSIRDFSDKGTLVGTVIQDENVYVLSEGVYKFLADFDSNTNIEEVKNPGDSNRNATLIEAYDRFVYVVNPEKRNIYRYAKEEDGYSEPVGWMKSATGLKYDELRSIAVDSNVWLTTSDGQLKKFTAGREETFELRGLEIPFKKDIYVYTNENLAKLYILDPANNRIVVFDKDGNFIKEFKSVSLASASNIAVSEDLNKIFIVSGSIIYQINL